ncbi:hypothetical protein SDRG_16884 [Saprolegnia diclina VS20]|uniref:Uncharacterized protein n=1 Tax=Saprolegnia diclina (strain VS20) TaxID=1156394 RepID=T0PSK8_SAPDV|nr:hypothetical protein SDRG_16884 [Saprolegnia diclina VS20]EQC25246.1 hypothetical protein SDRG_16884 [Saprolegnia diclina VS20]|eukprot:XP_008621330.1 hypothetical protein SDRG_16884 [Saprolegnia diclina VS20]
MAKVADMQSAARAVAARRQQFDVRWSRLPLLLSAIMFLNLVAMPMKAYVTEFLPWTYVPPPAPLASTNFTFFNASTLELLQRLYNRSTLPPHVTYHEDAAGYVLRKTINPRITSLDACASEVLPGLPGAIFYGPSFSRLICAMAMADNGTAWNGSGDCIYLTFFTQPWIYQCLWLTSGDDLALNASAPGYTLTYAARPYPLAWWCPTKFAYRTLTTFYIAHLVWTRYYVQCVALATSLAVTGHRPLDVKNSASIWRYEVVLGDPTAMVLTDPLVAFLLCVDIVASYDTLTFAVLRATQSADVYVMLIAFLYLSCTVWLPYLAVSTTTLLVKRYHKERSFAQIDPTALAIATAILGPALTWCMGNVSFFLQFYQYLGRVAVPTSDQHTKFESAPDVIVYLVSLASLPLMYGFGRARWQGDDVGSTRRTLLRYSSFQNNPWKNRALLALVQCLEGRSKTSGDMMERGGSVYALFEANRQFERCPAISFRATDCFVLCHQDGMLRERLRLTLLSTLDRHERDASLAVPSTVELSDYCVNTLHVATRMENDMTSSAGPRLSHAVSLSSQPSAWCL